VLPPAFKQVDFGLQRAEDCFRLAALASDSKTLANKAKLSIAANSRTAISAARGHAQDSLSQAYYSQTSLRPQKRTPKGPLPEAVLPGKQQCETQSTRSNKS